MDFPGYRVVTADVPYCASCAAQHRATLPQVGFVRRYGTFLFNPAHIATVGFAVLLVLVGPSLLAGVIASPRDKMGWGFLGALVFGPVWTPAITWWMTRPDRFEPQTAITEACDISPDVGLFYEQRRYLYAFRNQAFAEAFERANRDRVWTAQDQARMQWTWGILAVVVLVALVVARVAMWYFTGG